MANQGQNTPTLGKRIIFFGDPMCSWCWGFAPVIGAIHSEFGETAPIRLVLGGLRAGETKPMNERSKEYVRGHWLDVHSATGQPFDFGFFDREGFVYDTEPACRAAVAARSLSPAMALAYFDAVQRAFYVDNRDVTACDTLTEVADSVGFDRRAFEAVFWAPEILEATRADFDLTHALGISGFPTLVLEDDVGQAYLTIGYRPLDMVRPHIAQWLRA